MMKLILFAGLLAVLLSRSEAMRCEDIEQCVTNFSVEENDINILCGSLRTLLSCMRSSLSDCRSSGAIPENALDAMDQQMQTYTSMMNDRCGGVESGSGAVKVSALALMSSILARFLL